MRRVFVLIIALLILAVLPCNAETKGEQGDRTDYQLQLKEKELELVTEKLNRISVEFAYMQEHARLLQQERAFLLKEQKRLQKEITESKAKKD